jgi:hypothetical protein
MLQPARLIPLVVVVDVGIESLWDACKFSWDRQLLSLPKWLSDPGLRGRRMGVNALGVKNVEDRVEMKYRSG